MSASVSGTGGGGGGGEPFRGPVLPVVRLAARRGGILGNLQPLADNRHTLVGSSSNRIV